MVHCAQWEKVGNRIVLFQAPSTAISWSVYEFFKHYLNMGGGGGEDGDTYETMTAMKSASATGQIGSRVSHLSPGTVALSSSNEDHTESIPMAVHLPSRL